MLLQSNFFLIKPFIIYRLVNLLYKMKGFMIVLVVLSYTYIDFV